MEEGQHIECKFTLFLTSAATILRHPIRIGELQMSFNPQTRPYSYPVLQYLAAIPGATSPAHHRMQTVTVTNSHSSVFLVCGEAKLRVGNPDSDRENMQTPQTQGWSEIRKSWGCQTTGWHTEPQWWYGHNRPTQNKTGSNHSIKAEQDWKEIAYI